MKLIDYIDDNTLIIPFEIYLIQEHNIDLDMLDCEDDLYEDLYIEYLYFINEV